MKRLLTFLLLFLVSFGFILAIPPKATKPIRILVITGGHDYNKEKFNQMLGSLGENISYQVNELPGAYEMFKPANRDKYDVLVFYHMWQKISDEEAKVFAECISQGKPLVVLHHSICAYDDWPEYINIIGGKYFHKPTTVNGKLYQPCSYIHDLNFKVKIADPKNPVTKGIIDFDIFDETYKGYYVSEDVTPILTTDEPSSTPVIGWTKKYGKARVVTIQSGHDVPTYENQNYRRLLTQSILWVYGK
jgi:type 1 glutamine amidotransferase